MKWYYQAAAQPVKDQHLAPLPQIANFLVRFPGLRLGQAPSSVHHRRKCEERFVVLITHDSQVKLAARDIEIMWASLL